ncbi:hypothetical protein [Rivularia sp. UHCC 0363]|nr:hypothetical protein [Rivularia sp. UHCC 0363]MEA5597251.1 hypothetical protein [Rivularia sp. UHCC 0363]
MSRKTEAIALYPSVNYSLPGRRLPIKKPLRQATALGGFPDL